VPLNFVVNDQWLAPDESVADAQGVCVIPLPIGRLGRLDAGAHVPGYENRFFTWRADWQHPRPEEYILRLGRAETVGGQVVDEQRRPIAGVSVWLAYSVSDTSWREPEQDQERLGFMRRILLGTTDTQGRWVCATIPPTRERFGFEFEHPDYVKDDSLSVSRDDPSAVGREVLANLRARTALTQLRRGLVVNGRIVDSAGDPVATAKIASAWHEESVPTDADGQFTIRRLPPGEVMFVATAPGFAPKHFNAEGGGKSIRVRLETGGVLRARILNTNGEPIAGATLLLDEGFGVGSLGWDDRSDADGWVQWNRYVVCQQSFPKI
jgi:protocatechuate 3,4-dioxygenase beta subunit